MSGETILLEDDGDESIAEKVIEASRKNYSGIPPVNKPGILVNDSVDADTEYDGTDEDDSNNSEVVEEDDTELS